MNDSVDNYAIKQALENEVCPVHQKQATIEVTQTGFQFSSCCEEFNKELTSKATKMTTDQITASITNIFKKGFKF